MSETSPQAAMIASLLGRIVVALEESNAINREWITINHAWRKENQETDIGPRVVAIHEENARREQVHREEIIRLIEEQARIQNEIAHATHEAYMESLTTPDNEEKQQHAE